MNKPKTIVATGEPNKIRERAKKLEKEGYNVRIEDKADGSYSDLYAEKPSEHDELER